MPTEIDNSYNYTKRLLRHIVKVLYELDGKTLTQIRKELPPEFGPEIRDLAQRMDCLTDDSNMYEVWND